MYVGPNKTCTGVIYVASLRVVAVLNMEMVSIVNISDQPQVLDGNPLCKCGHTQNQHLGLTDYCLIEMSDNSVRHSNWHTKCPCLKFEQLIEHGIHIATLLNQEGEARILFEFEDVHLQIVPDTCAQIALQLLSAVYASRAEQALFKYAQDNLIDPDTLVRFVRS